MLVAAQADGEVRADIDPALAARLISAVMDGIQQQWLLDDCVDMNALFAEFVRGYLLPLPAGRPTEQAGTTADQARDECASRERPRRATPGWASDAARTSRGPTR